MLRLLFILIQYLLCCTSYWVYKTDSLFTFFVFISPFYFPFSSFLFFDLGRKIVMPGKYKAAVISGASFYFILLLLLPLQKWIPDFLSADEYSIIIPAAVSYVPVFIINKQYNIYGVLFLLLSFIVSYDFIRNGGYSIFLPLGGNSSMKGDTLVLSYLSASFVCAIACTVLLHLKKAKILPKTSPAANNL